MLIIPAIDLKKGEVVRLYKGRFDKISFYEIELEKTVREYIKNGAKRLHIVLLYGAKTGEIGKEEKEKLNKIIEVRNSTDKNCKIQVGGGVRRYSQIKNFIDMGIDYIIIGTAFLIPIAMEEGFSIQDIKFYYQQSGKKLEIEKEVPEIELIDIIGNDLKEKIIVSIDYFKNQIALSGWEVSLPLQPSYVIKKFLQKGIKKFILTNIECDGTLEGIDIESIDKILKELSKYDEKPEEIILAGGISKEEDLMLIDSLKYKPAGVIIGKALYQKKLDLKYVIEKYQEI